MGGRNFLSFPFLAAFFVSPFGEKVRGGLVCDTARDGEVLLSLLQVEMVVVLTIMAFVQYSLLMGNVLVVFACVSACGSFVRNSVRGELVVWLVVVPRMGGMLAIMARGVAFRNKSIIPAFHIFV